ncbi:hypothetical protein RIF29_05278 [Crotalaria pallida]|uniref:Bromodomain associated domain-containing protein n=1 Tax=Crotalaria pallida TaxID=3830 RepID=A0AAN9J2N3_CROPI
MNNKSAAKAKAKAPRKTKGKKKRNSPVNVAQVAETPSEFALTVNKIAVAQICQSIGYKRSKCNALETLTNVATKYIQAIARSASSFANASNRTDVNFFDLVNGINDMSSDRGFSGGSTMHKSNLLKSGALRDIMSFVNLSNEVPFAKPNLEHNVDSCTSTSACCQEAKVQHLHIPRWLPDFPKESLYKNCDKVLIKERKCGEKLWEHSLAICNGNVEENKLVFKRNEIDVREGKEARMKLAKRRGRVKFKIGGKEEKQIVLGVNSRNGACKGRKRVSWSHDKMTECMVQKDEDEMSALKRKR